MDKNLLTTNRINGLKYIKRFAFTSMACSVISWSSMSMADVWPHNWPVAINGYFIGDIVSSFSSDYDQFGYHTQIMMRKSALGFEAANENFKASVGFSVDAKGKFALEPSTLTYVGMDSLTFGIGKVRSFTGIEATTSTKYTLLMDKSAMQSLYAGDLYAVFAKYDKDSLHLHGGVGQLKEDDFGGNPAGAANKDKGTPFTVPIRFYYEEQTGELFNLDVLHVGANYAYQGYNSRYQFQAPAIKPPFYFLDSDDIISGNSIETVDDTNTLGLELIAQFDNMWVQTEAKWQRISQSAAQFSDSANVYGAYAYFGFFLTDTNHQYSASSGQLRPPKVVNENGEIEVIAQFSMLNTDKVNDLSNNTDGAKEYNLGGAVTWYIDEQVKVMANLGWNKVDFKDSSQSNVSGLLGGLRAQYMF